MKILIKAAEIFTENDIIKNGNVLVEDGIIAKINTGEPGDKTIELGELRLTPGLIDTHIHGANGSDVMEGTYEAVENVSAHILKNGVTSFLPTTVTASLESIRGCLASVREALKRGVSGAKILGVFIEGPYISKDYRGAHPADKIRPIDLSEIEDILNDGAGPYRMFLIAPEGEKGIEAIRLLKNRGVAPTIGHTFASYDKAAEAFGAGALISTHTYNAMSPLNHREPGVVGAAMTCDGVYAELICDGVHVAYPAAKVLVRAKGYDKITLITDSMSAAGFPDGEYMLGELKVYVKNSVARTFETNSLAGSTLNFNIGVKNFHEQVGVPLLEAFKAATLNPARAIGADNIIGSIKEGKIADLAAFDKDFNAKFVMVDGGVKIQKL